jgi:hypothetical protein
MNVELAYLAVAYGMAGIMLYVTRYNKFPTLSHIATDNKLTRYVFFWGLLIAGALFAVLMYGWAIPYFSLGIGIKILVGMLLLCQVLTGFFPIEGSKFRHAHIIFASGLTICMFALLATLALTNDINYIIRLANGLFALSMIALVTTARHVQNGEYLFHEKIFFGLWHAAIFITVYFG